MVKKNSYASVKRWRTLLKRRIVVGFSGKCGVCGLKDNDIVYDFHHIDPSQKDFLLTNKIRSWESLVQEAKKCVMLCSHCHRKIHSGLATIPDDIPVFSEELIASSEYAISTGPDFDLCICGKQKHVMRKGCSIRCAASLRLIHKRPQDMGAVLKDVETRGFWAVAREIGITDNTLRKWLKAAGHELPRFRGPNRIKLPPLAQQ